VGRCTLTTNPPAAGVVILEIRGFAFRGRGFRGASFDGEGCSGRSLQPETPELFANIWRLAGLRLLVERFQITEDTRCSFSRATRSSFSGFMTRCLYSPGWGGWAWLVRRSGYQRLSMGCHRTRWLKKGGRRAGRRRLWKNWGTGTGPAVPQQRLLTDQTV